MLNPAWFWPGLVNPLCPMRVHQPQGGEEQVPWAVRTSDNSGEGGIFVRLPLR
jgi:hypothetical protein